MDAALVIMAAGMGSRYGGNKQIDGMGPNGEILMEYSIYDAIRAGFNKIVFVIKPEMEETLKELCGDRIAKQVDVAYVYQTFDSIPDFYHIPEERTKPFGTVHAVLAAKDVVDSPFAVLNADDYYGVSAFKTMYDALCDLPETGAACMVGYRLKNTVSENGTVTRGVCSVEDGKLAKVTETYKIKPFDDGTIRDINFHEEGDIIDPDSLVSMNFWGFTPWMFEVMDTYFENFLKNLEPDNIKGECLLPIMIDELMRSKKVEVEMYSTDCVWFGITYKEDKPEVEKSIRALHDNGTYPPSLKD